MIPVFKRRLRHYIRPFPKLTFKKRISINWPSLSWTLTIGYILILLGITFGPLFRLRTFICQTNTKEPCPDFVIPELEKKKGELAYLANFDTLIETFNHTLPQAESISIQPQWPNIVATSIIWQPGIANLQIPASTSALLVSESGQLITLIPNPDPDLPTIIASSAADLIISDHLSDSSLQAALELVKQCGQFSIPISEINIHSPIDIRVFLKNQKVSVFTSQKSITQQVNTLHLILSDPTMNQNLPIIDVRYDRPALKPVLPS